MAYTSDLNQNRKPGLVALLGMVVVLVALTIVGLACYKHQVVTRIISNSAGNAEDINIAGRQRMLSQRISLFAHRLVHLQDMAALPLLQDAVSLMGASHERLAARVRQPGAPESLKLVYYAPETDLDGLTRNYLSNASSIIKVAEQGGDFGPAEERLLGYMLADAQDRLLQPLDRAVKGFEDYAEAQVTELRSREQTTWLSMMLVLLVVLLGVVMPLVCRVRRYMRIIEDMARQDEATGVLNRREFLRQSGIELYRAKRYEHDLALLLMDLDDFDEIVEQHGVKPANDALRFFADMVRSGIRKDDIFARIGGRTFGLMLPQTSLAGAQIVAAKLMMRLNSNELVVDTAKGLSVRVTVSIGIATHREDDNLASLYARAEAALEKVWREGSDEVLHAHPYVPGTDPLVTR